MTFQIGWLEQFVSWRELFSSNWKSALPIVFDIGPLKSIFDAVITDTAIGIYDGLIKPFAQFASWLGIGFVNVIKAGYLGVTNFFMNIGNTIGGYLKAPFIAFKDWITPWWNSFIDILPAGLKKILGVEPIIIAPPVIPNPVPPPSVNPIPGFDSGRNFSENNTPIDDARSLAEGFGITSFGTSGVESFNSLSKSNQDSIMNDLVSQWEDKGYGGDNFEDFALGGRIRGVPGTPVKINAHAGETVIRENQRLGNTFNIVVNVDRDVSDPIRTGKGIASSILGHMTRSGSISSIPLAP